MQLLYALRCIAQAHGRARLIVSEQQAGRLQKEPLLLTLWCAAQSYVVMGQGMLTVLVTQKGVWGREAHARTRVHTHTHTHTHTTQHTHTPS